MVGLIGAGVGALGTLGNSALSLGGKFLGSKLGQSAIGLGASFGGSYADSLMSHYFGKKSSKYSAEQQMRIAKKMVQLQKGYNEWYIPFVNDENLKFAENYARNSPSWNVKALRDAGLNPILAANGGFSTSTPSGASGASVSSGSSPSSFGGRPNTKVDPLLMKNLELLDAQIQGEKIKNNNELKNRGLTGKYGALSRLISESGISKDDPVSPHRPKDYTHVLDSIGEVLGYKFGNDVKSKPNPYTKTSPRTIEADIIKRSREDTPPSMPSHQKYFDSDGFDSRFWSRSRRKYDGNYFYEPRQLWKSLFTR